MTDSFIYASWPAPQHIVAGTSTRVGGYSTAAYQGLNLATHVGDELSIVEKNRAFLMKQIALPSEPIWLQQVHGAEVFYADNKDSNTPCADATVSFKVNQICAVLTADCLPVLITDTTGSCVAAAHVGWRGLCNGILEHTVSELNRDPTSLLIWFGPAISRQVYEVGEEVRQILVNDDNEAQIAFSESRPNHWLMDLYQLARQRLNRLGITEIYGGDFCTYSQADLFYSYRRDGTTGRMASLIWKQSS